MQKQNSIYLFLIALVSAMGGLLFGYDWVVIGGAKPFYEAFFNIGDSPNLQGWAMSSALIGCLFGALVSGVLSDMFGRKKMLIVAAFLFIISAVGTGAVDTFNFFIVYRIIGGFAIGIASNLSPMYIAEISPAHLRGRMVSLNQMTIVLGILMAQIVNMLIAQPVVAEDVIIETWNGQTGWRHMFWAENVPALAFLIFAFIIPESPRWLSVKGFDSKALAVMTKISGEQVAKAEYEKMRENIQNDKSEGLLAGLKMVFSSKLSRVLIIGVFLAIFQQWCGINVIFNYAEEIFKAAGYGVSDMLLNVVITGVTNVVFTIVAFCLVDKIGRKPLLLIGSGALALIYVLMGCAYFFELKGIALLIIVIMAIACYAMSLAPVIWVVISEIFPNAIRGTAMSIATFALWSACFILTYTFPILNKNLGASGTFWIYAGICFIGFIFIAKNVPETKNKSLEEIEKELVK